MSYLNAAPGKPPKCRNYLPLLIRPTGVGACESSPGNRFGRVEGVSAPSVGLAIFISSGCGHCRHNAAAAGSDWLGAGVRARYGFSFVLALSALRQAVCRQVRFGWHCVALFQQLPSLRKHVGACEHQMKGTPNTALDRTAGKPFRFTSHGRACRRSVLRWAA